MAVEADGNLTAPIDRIARACGVLAGQGRSTATDVILIMAAPLRRWR
jgi:hypothetical protein